MMKGEKHKRKSDVTRPQGRAGTKKKTERKIGDRAYLGKKQQGALSDCADMTRVFRQAEKF